MVSRMDREVARRSGPYDLSHTMDAVMAQFTGMMVSGEFPVASRFKKNFQKSIFFSRRA